ncbi:MAG: hypothetical protein RJB66_110 [Pseudomonadota bacterium]
MQKNGMFLFILVFNIFYLNFSRAESSHRYIIRFKPTFKASTVMESYSHLAIKNKYDTLWSGFSASLTPNDLQQLKNDDRIEEVFEDQEVHLDGLNVQQNASWGLSRIDQRQRLSDDFYEYAYTGEGITVYIIDTGINIRHSEFQGRAQIGASFVRASKSDGGDCHGHGSHVAAIVGGKEFGVAKKVKLVGLRTLDCKGSGSLSDILEALDWVGRYGPSRSVVNISIGTIASKHLDDTIGLLVARGVTVVVSAGNSSQDACLQSPARAPAAITVGAIEQGDRKAFFSNDGPCVDVFAPGTDILSAHKGHRTSTKVLSGTSMATPFVTGVMALAIQQFPKKSTATIRKYVLERATEGVVIDASASKNNVIYSR